MDRAGSLPGLVLVHATKLRRAGLCCANVAKLTLGVVDQVICLVDIHSCQLMTHCGAVNLHMCVVWLKLTRQTVTEQPVEPEPLKPFYSSSRWALSLVMTSRFLSSSSLFNPPYPLATGSHPHRYQLPHHGNLSCTNSLNSGRSTSKNSTHA